MRSAATATGLLACGVVEVAPPPQPPLLPGEPQYNMVLGAHRANGVADYLARAGVERSRVDLTSRGALDASGVDDVGQQADRRVDLVLVQ